MIEEYLTRILWFIIGFIIGGLVLRNMMKFALKSVISKWETDIKKKGVEEYKQQLNKY
jgi:uncharacterized membrane-anchored protein YhcB (DUF1043 family)|tara:strand:- start:6305 stop:6478 length:174 start_codon:yes stop_codon:yes gene_type:complete